MLRACLAGLLLALGCQPSAAQQPVEDPLASTYVASGSGTDWSVMDPWERFNRRSYKINSAIDRAFLRPVAKGYDKVTPRLIRTGVRHFFTNLQQPVVALNLLLQGHPGQAGTATGRFLLNATFGLGGVLDPASHAGIPRRDKDFGQTFAKWGWKRSRYLVLPLFGSGTVRDTVGKGVNTRFSPLSELAKRNGPAITFLYGIDTRASVLKAEETFMQGAEDEYMLLREVYFQRRACQLRDCRDDLPDYLSPDYEYEIPDIDWRR
jgi:phospholipid-binding lipoprotein MlaA